MCLTIDSNNLIITEVSHTGQQLLTLLPFLKIGVMFPIFQSFGNNPLSRDLVNNIAKGTHNWFAQFF